MVIFIMYISSFFPFIKDLNIYNLNSMDTTKIYLYGHQ